MELRGAGSRWFALGCVMFGNANRSAKRITFAHGAVQNRIRPCKCKFQCKRKCKFECKRNLKWFLPPFCKNMLPARAGSTFLKTNSEQSAFKNPLFGALKASNEDSLGHLFGTYGSQTFFFAAFPLQSPIRILKNRRQNVLLSHMEPSKIGSDLANANFNANASANSNANAIWSDFCLRLGPFEAIFASVWVRFRFVFRRLGLCKCTCKCTCNRKWKCNCYLIRATGGLSIDI